MQIINDSPFIGQLINFQQHINSNSTSALFDVFWTYAQEDAQKDMKIKSISSKPPPHPKRLSYYIQIMYLKKAQ